MSYNVLIVDDSKIARAMVKKSIVLAGVSVGNIYEAGNGLEALSVLEQHWVDIVFSDLSMPQMNGLEMVRKMADAKIIDNVPVVIISSDQNENLANDLASQGVRAYLRKPFRPEELRGLVGRLLKDEALQ